jgi:hypothetical protein
MYESLPSQPEWDLDEEQPAWLSHSCGYGVGSTVCSAARITSLLRRIKYGMGIQGLV